MAESTGRNKGIHVNPVDKRKPQLVHENPRMPGNSKGPVGGGKPIDGKRPQTTANTDPARIDSKTQGKPIAIPGKGSNIIKSERLRDPENGQFITDPDNPPSPNTYTDAQRRADWRRDALDPNSPLTEAQRKEIKERGWRGPQRVNEYGEVETMERSHEPVPLHDGGTETVPKWPSEHAETDPHRHLKKR